jgi:hypothetical protein
LGCDDALTVGSIVAAPDRAGALYIWRLAGAGSGVMAARGAPEEIAGGLGELYAELCITGELTQEVWDEWLWKTDPEAPFAGGVLMNRCQLLGFLVCLSRGMDDDESEEPPAAVSGDRFALTGQPVSGMTLRGLRDTVENLQIEWPQFLERLGDNPHAQQNLDAVIQLLDRCVARFGALCLHSWGAEVLDDLSSIEPASPSDPEPAHFRVSYACIRRTVCTFLVMYRHLHLLAVCRPVPARWADPGISKYHVEASNDDFNLLCMNLSLPVAARLNYKHDFPGMYNHVSQVVFFHNSEYQRKARAALEALPTAPIEHVLPALMQLYPSIGVRYEEDSIDLSASSPQGLDWFWLVVAGRVYLVDAGRAVWHSPDVTSLLGVYLEATGAARGGAC